MTCEIWMRADGPDDADARKELVITALEAGISRAVVRPGDGSFSGLGRMELITPDSLTCVSIGSPEEQEKVMGMAGQDITLLIDTPDWTVIPLENLMARFRDTPTRVLVAASDPDQAGLFSGILEKGVDGIVVDTEDPETVRMIAERLSGGTGIDLPVLEVLGVKDIGMGDRVCVDTVSVMSPGEGMLVGSQAACLFLVQSESEDNGYVAARPFRVNAGAVHAYVMVPGGKTRYLSELRSGEPVALVDSDGNVRESSVGRCKIERRPMLMVTARFGEDTYTTILQNAETVKLVGPDGALSAPSLGPGDRVYAMIGEGGRHFGMRVDETVREI